MRCVKKVEAKGKSKSSAFAICTTSTGQKVEKKASKK
jgi:hypothetical protein